MPHRQVEFHPEAAAEAEEPWRGTANRSVRAASEFLGELDRAVAAILQYPGRWPEMRAGIRRYPLKRFPFVVYREVLSLIQVLAIAHGRRRPGYWEGREQH